MIFNIIVIVDDIVPLSTIIVIVAALVAITFYYFPDTATTYIFDILTIFDNNVDSNYPSSTSTHTVKSQPHHPAEQDENQNRSYNFHGTDIYDSFLWLESSSSNKWVNDQEVLNSQHLQSIHRLKSLFFEKLEVTKNYEVVEPPFHFGDRYYYFKKSFHDQPQFSLYATKDLRKEGKLVLDMKRINKNMRNITQSRVSCVLHGSWFSSDGNMMAYGVSTLSSPMMSIGVRDLSRKLDLFNDSIPFVGPVVKISVCWLERDNQQLGFFYTSQSIECITKSCKYGKQQFEPSTSQNISSHLQPDINPNEDSTNQSTAKIFVNRVYFHRLGSIAREDDLLIFELESDVDAVALNIIISSDGHYLIVEAHRNWTEISNNSGYQQVIGENYCSFDMGNKVYCFDLTSFTGFSASTIGYCIKLIDVFAYRFEYISNIEQDFWFRTNFRANNYRVVRITLPDVRSDVEVTVESEYKFLMAWKTALEWIPEREGYFLESAGIAAHTVLVLKYLAQNTQSHEVLLYDITQTLLDQSRIPVAELPHPPYGTISGPNCSFSSSQIFYRCSDLSDPGSIYRAVIKRDLFSGSIEIIFDQLGTTTLPGLDKYQFETTSEKCTISSNDNGVTSDDSESISNATTDINLLLLAGRDVLDTITDSRLQSNESNPHRQQQLTRPCIIYSYGGFGVPITPVFSLPLLLFVKYCRGIVVLVAQQDKGRHSIGNKFFSSSDDSSNGCNDSRRFDLSPVLRHLISKGYTSPSQIALFGGSHAGISIGLSLAKHPELFSAAVVNNGIFDLLRLHILNPPLLPHRPSADKNSNNGSDEGVKAATAPHYWRRSLWCEEYGCAEESVEECDRMKALSPLHCLAHLPPVATFPAVLLNIQDINSANLVSKVHSFKFAAELQRVLNSRNQNADIYVRQWRPSPTAELPNENDLTEEQLHDKDKCGQYINSRVQHVAPAAEATAELFAFIMYHTHAEWFEFD